MKPRDVQRMEHIVDYCEDIEDTLLSIDQSSERFFGERQAQYAIAFSILQIGELVGKLSDELRSETKDQMDWPAIKGMRNIIVHDYGEIRLNVVWDVATHDIPNLKAFCLKQLDEA